VQAAPAEIGPHESDRTVIDGERDFIRRSVALDLVGFEKRRFEHTRSDLE
jgi:hypothetical protein